MDEKTEPDFIDMESLNLTQISDIPAVSPYMPQVLPDIRIVNSPDIRIVNLSPTTNNHKISSREYLNESMLLIIKNNIFNLIDMIIDAEDNENNKSAKMYINLLINTIIINGKILEQSETVSHDIQEKLSAISKSYSVMCLYKMLANINKHRSVDNVHFRVIQPITNKYPPMPEDLRKVIELRLPQFRYRKQMQVLRNKPPPQFKVDQIVGGRDKTHRWWLSRVLHVYNDPNSKFHWYYVHFEGWPKCSREWICSSSYSIRQFNPKRHVLKRPSR